VIPYNGCDVREMLDVVAGKKASASMLRPTWLSGPVECTDNKASQGYRHGPSRGCGCRCR
jgi:hypothetical protein